MSTFRVLVAEDEPLGMATVVELLRRDPDVSDVTECVNARCVSDAVGKQTYDIAFLDIEMPGATGIEIAQSMGPAGPVIVFVTAFPSYAPNAFDVNAVDYVLKPFSDERFVAALDRAKLRVRERRLGIIAGQLATVSAEIGLGAPAAKPAYLTRVPCRVGERSLLIRTADIIWIEADDYYVKLHTRQGDHLLRATLASLGARLDPAVFQRVHRTALVNVDEIVEVRQEDRLVLVLSNDTRVPVSRTRRTAIEAIVRPRVRGR